MLKKVYRLPASVKRKFSQSFTTPFFLLRIAKNGLPINRYGFVISKKVDKRATARNKAKRALRSCIEKMLKDINSGNDMLFFIKKEVLNTPSENLCLFMQTFFKKEEFLK
ncbi:MAG: ribonuclease P protein component [Candidatus Levybacteria bacterium]|nr:ribonuclease P protein component [Candidatus Levybacteria bacterium]